MEVTTKSSMMTFAIPEDPEELQAWGEVMLRHSHLDHALKMMIKTLAGIEIIEALDASKFTPSSELRRRIRRLAKLALGEGSALIRVEALLEQCRRATERRNELVHNIVGRELDGDIKMRTDDHTWRPMPTLDELTALNSEFIRLATQLNAARLRGFLKEALDKKNPAGRAKST